MRPVPTLLMAALAAGGALLGTAGPAGAAAASVVSITPKSVATSGSATVRFHVTGGTVASTTSIVIRGSEFDRSEWSQEVESLSIKSVVLLGSGSMNPALPPLTGYPPSCERGGIHPSSSVSAYTLTIPAGKSADLLVTAGVPVGFASQTPAVELSSSPLVATGQTPPLDAPDDVVRAPIPRTGRALEGVELEITRASGRGHYVATGQIHPARGGAIVRFVGRRAKLDGRATGATLIAAQKLGRLADAMLPLDDAFTAYGKTRTSPDGTFKVPFTAPSGTVIVARTRGAGGITDPGASCPLQVG